MHVCVCMGSSPSQYELHYEKELGERADILYKVSTARGGRVWHSPTCVFRCTRKSLGLHGQHSERDVKECEALLRK